MRDCKPDIYDMIACARRELAYRRKVYPRLVFQGKMKQHTADTELARMQAILEYLENDKNNIPVDKLL